MSWVILAAAACLAIAIAYWHAGTKRPIGTQVHKLFGVSALRYKLISVDLGGYKGTAIKYDGMIGCPDAVFLSPAKAIAGEYKSRRYRGKVRPRERYQVILYCGMLRQIHGVNATGLIRYKDQVIEIPYCHKTYKWLRSLRSKTAAATH